MSLFYGLQLGWADKTLTLVAKPLAYSALNPEFWMLEPSKLVECGASLPV
jgi:hypothetical protein